jgi:hypothetical protein
MLWRAAGALGSGHAAAAAAAVPACQAFEKQANPEPSKPSLHPH